MCLKIVVIERTTCAKGNRIVDARAIVFRQIKLRSTVHIVLYCLVAFLIGH